MRIHAVDKPDAVGGDLPENGIFDHAGMVVSGDQVRIPHFQPGVRIAGDVAGKRDRHLRRRHELAFGRILQRLREVLPAVVLNPVGADEVHAERLPVFGDARRENRIRGAGVMEGIVVRDRHTRALRPETVALVPEVRDAQLAGADCIVGPL